MSDVLTKEFFERNFEPERRAHTQACPRYPVKKLLNLIPPRFFERNLEQNQKVASCCRHPEEHDIEAFYSTDRERDRGVPDIYVFHCNGCGRKHRVFCVGGSAGSGPNAPTEMRPKWAVA